MQRPNNLKVGEKFKVIVETSIFKMGEIITLYRDDGTDCPFFWKEDKSKWHYMHFSTLEPLPKTIRDAQVGDVVVDKDDGEERMVLERGQNTVDLSWADDFKKSGIDYHFDELEEYFTLKNAPVVADNVVLTMNEIAEKFGVDVSTLKIAKE